MFGIGFGELLIIIVVLIIAVGPEQLPSFMRTIGKTIRSMRQASQDLRDSIGLDDIMNRDIMNFRPPPYRPPTPPKIGPSTKEAKPTEKEAAPNAQNPPTEVGAEQAKSTEKEITAKTQDSPAETSEKDTTKSVEDTNRDGSQIDQDEKKKLVDRTGEN